MKDLIKHIRHTHEDKKRSAWCGRNLWLEFAFANIDHAAYNNLNHDRLVPCKRCVKAIVKALESNQ